MSFLDGFLGRGGGGESTDDPEEAMLAVRIREEALARRESQVEQLLAIDREQLEILLNRLADGLDLNGGFESPELQEELEQQQQLVETQQQEIDRLREDFRMQRRGTPITGTGVWCRQGTTSNSRV